MNSISLPRKQLSELDNKWTYQLVTALKVLNEPL